MQLDSLYQTLFQGQPLVWDTERLATNLQELGLTLNDDELKKVNNNYTDEIVSFTGKKGDILIIDTSKCLHMGSRCNSERYQLFITYTPIETNDLNTLSSIKKYQFLNEKIKNLNIY